MKKTIILCNKCGAEFSATDKVCGFHVSRPIGYGSVHDGEWLVIDLCCECLDAMIGSCKINPTEPAVVDGKPVKCSGDGNAECPSFYTVNGNTDPYQIPLEV